MAVKRDAKEDDNYAQDMVKACKKYGMKPICDHPAYCKDDTKALYLGQTNHITGGNLLGEEQLLKCYGLESSGAIKTGASAYKASPETHPWMPPYYSTPYTRAFKVVKKKLINFKKSNIAPLLERWKVCAEGEGQECICTGQVLYGRKFLTGNPGSGATASVSQMKTTGYKTKEVSGSITCSNSGMGGDPLSGYYKYCQCKASSSGADHYDSPLLTH